MKRFRRVWLILGFLLFVGAGVFFYLLNATPRLFSSPTEPRIETGYHGAFPVPTGQILESFKEPPRGHAARHEMDRPRRVEGLGGEFVLTWETEKPTPLTDLPNAWTQQLLGDDEIELFAFATWHPEPDDDRDDPEWRASMRFRDPESLQSFDSDELERLKIPKDWNSSQISQHDQKPWIRLIFRSENMPVTQIYGPILVDARTGARVNPSHMHSASTSGPWTRMDLLLNAWRDTPVKIWAIGLTGEPMFAELPMSVGKQAVFGDRLRLQFAAEGIGIRALSSISATHPLAPGEDMGLLEPFIKGNVRPGITPPFAAITRHRGWQERQALLRSSAGAFGRHVGILDDETGNYRWDWAHGELGLLEMMWTRAPKTKGPMNLVFLPQKTELMFEIAGLPDLPNLRSIESLFEVRMPRLTLPPNFGFVVSSERDFLESIAEAVQMPFQIKRYCWRVSQPEALPDDLTFHDTSPQQLLDWYLENTPEANARIDEETGFLVFNEERNSRWDRIKAWWKRTKPNWLK
ncbi:MAG: hypothetical protein ACI8UO_003349 [Verrucomicrobiales bacterium]|jgi:hypothetical protein